MLRSIVRYLRTPWWRLPVLFVPAGIVLILVDIIARLQWIPFLVGLVLVAWGAAVAVKMGRHDGARALSALCAGALVLMIGIGWLHPQGWKQPGWGLPTPSTRLVYRVGNLAFFKDRYRYTMRTLAGGKVHWSHVYREPIAITGTEFVVRSSTDPSHGHAYSLTSHRHEGVVAWPPTVTTIPESTTMTALERSLLPTLGSDDKVVAQAVSGDEAARIVATSDPTGHRFQRLDVVVDNAVTTYRVKDATGLLLRDQVLEVLGPRPRVLPLVRVA